MYTYLFIKHLFLHIKYLKILTKIYKQENLIDNLSKLFGAQFKKDWIHRVYVVLNPYVSNNSLNIQDQILEYTGEGLDDKKYIESYIMRQLNLANNFIINNDLFDMLTYKIKDLGDYNYLFIIYPITWPDCVSFFKKCLIEILTVVIFFSILYILLTYFNF